MYAGEYRLLVSGVVGQVYALEAHGVFVVKGFDQVPGAVAAAVIDKEDKAVRRDLPSGCKPVEQIEQPLR